MWLRSLQLSIFDANAAATKAMRESIRAKNRASGEYVHEKCQLIISHEYALHHTRFLC